MAIACFGLVTFLPLRPERSVPFFISRISVSTFLPADGEYLRVEDFFEAVLRAGLFAIADFFFVAISFSSEFRWHAWLRQLLGRNLNDAA